MHFHSFNGLDELLLPRQRQTMNIMLLYCLFLLVGSLLLSSLCSHDTVPLYVFLLKCSQTTVSKLYRGFYLVMSTYSVFLPLSLPPLLFADRLTYYVTIFGSLFTLFDNIYACILYWVRVFTELLRTVVLIIFYICLSFWLSLDAVKHFVDVKSADNWPENWYPSAVMQPFTKNS